MGALTSPFLCPNADADPTLAILFAGQGAQHPGMGAEMAEAEEAARVVYEAADAARPGTSAQCFHADADELKVTANTQPCVFATDLACAAALSAHGVRPGCVAGFSLGELAALTYAGVFETGDGFAVVAERARLMEAACEAQPGAMAAVLKLAPERVEELARQVGDCWPVNYNSPQQTVVAGRPEAIAALQTAAREAGGRVMPLAVSGAFHSPLMASASEALLPYLRGVRTQAPCVDVWSNTLAAPYPDDPAQIAALLARQASSPVRWTDTLAGMAARGVTTFVEVGPGHVLTGLVRRTLPDALALSVETPGQLADALAAIAAR